MKISIALFIDDKDIINYFTADERFNVVGCTTNGNSALSVLKDYQPHAAICDIMLKDIDGFYVMQRSKEFSLPTKMLAYSAFDSDEIIRCACNHGADMYLVKPLPPEILAERIGWLLETDIKQTKPQLDKLSPTADLRISNVFLAAGIPPHIKGYNFLRTGVKYAMDNPAVLGNITKQLYPAIAQNYDTSASKVERAIRHAIEVAWNRGRIEKLNSMLGVSFYTTGDKPTNGEFIALIADRLLQEQRMGKL